MLPWREERHPWSVWVSEVMLQQTTAAVVAERLPAFLSRFPDVASLARASEEEVLSAWAGLGYYRRARALHAAAGIVLAEHGGEVPRELAALRALPGVGSYTAAAIASIAHGIPAAAVDGNVARVLARLLGEERAIDSARVRSDFERSLAALFPEGASPSRFTEAWIELGALLCRPKDPDCDGCPVASGCTARASDRVEALPVRKPRAASKAVVSHRALVRRGGRTMLIARPEDDSLLPGWLELPGRWGPPGEDPERVLTDVLAAHGLEATIGPALGEVRHAITTHRITARLHPAEVRGRTRGSDVHWLDDAALAEARLTTESKKLLRKEL